MFTNQKFKILIYFLNVFKKKLFYKYINYKYFNKYCKKIIDFEYYLKYL